VHEVADCVRGRCLDLLRLLTRSAGLAYHSITGPRSILTRAQVTSPQAFEVSRSGTSYDQTWTDRQGLRNAGRDVRRKDLTLTTADHNGKRENEVGIRELMFAAVPTSSRKDFKTTRSFITECCSSSSALYPALMMSADLNRACKLARWTTMSQLSGSRISLWETIDSSCQIFHCLTMPLIGIQRHCSRPSCLDRSDEDLERWRRSSDPSKGSHCRVPPSSAATRTPRPMVLSAVRPMRSLAVA
jgi:hypothetical protein